MTRRSVEQEALRSLRDPERWCWPGCFSGPWDELDLPLCAHHAAKVYLRLEDAKSAEPSDERAMWTHQCRPQQRPHGGIVRRYNLMEPDLGRSSE